MAIRDDELARWDDMLTKTGEGWRNVAARLIVEVRALRKQVRGALQVAADHKCARDHAETTLEENVRALDAAERKLAARNVIMTDAEKAMMVSGENEIPKKPRGRKKTVFCFEGEELELKP